MRAGRSFRHVLSRKAKRLYHVSYRPLLATAASRRDFLRLQHRAFRGSIFRVPGSMQVSRSFFSGAERVQHVERKILKCTPEQIFVSLFTVLSLDLPLANG